MRCAPLRGDKTAPHKARLHNIPSHARAHIASHGMRQGDITPHYFWCGLVLSHAAHQCGDMSCSLVLRAVLCDVSSRCLMCCCISSLPHSIWDAMVSNETRSDSSSHARAHTHHIITCTCTHTQDDITQHRIAYASETIDHAISLILCHNMFHQTRQRTSHGIRRGETIPLRASDKTRRHCTAA